MLRLEDDVRVYIFTKPCDMRCGFYRLADLIKANQKLNQMSGELFVFLSRCRKWIKILYWDKDGYALYRKRRFSDRQQFDRAPDMPVAVGRKNYLFTGGHRGAEVAALFYSLINSCKLNKVNPFEYLCDVLRRIQDHSIKHLDALLPHNWTLAAK